MQKLLKTLGALEKAVASLEVSLAQPVDEFVRDSVIQRFEYSFELSWKLMFQMIKHSDPDFDGGARRTLREAAEKGLIKDLKSWLSFSDARNLSVHTYNEEVAMAIEKTARESFLSCCHEFLAFAQAEVERDATN
jgi:nucleotidyltransferase substrate binding protein (TIGR01987 family)